ncbi:MATE family efflux transporter [Photobacterium chitinilyticum]|uniref:MATE family efflux transporter n=1 Tax=Photobacterium chitinilyticum TaxID=2485123 RepID=UPI0018EF4C38|nr:MATE family efflux transporter [Photobacterium chitinilyticum]
MAAKQVIKNTIALYFRQIIVTIVSLLVIRNVLKILGVEDYGIYTVITGIVSLCVFIPGALGSASQRFFAFAIGKDDSESISKILFLNLTVYLLMALAIALLLESIGLWFVMEHLNIPADRYEVAIKLYHYSVLSFIFSLLTSPFISIIIAHEDMRIYAYASIFEAFLKLGSVYLLSKMTWDKLEIYGCLLLVVSIVNMTTYIVCSFIKYKAIRKFPNSFDKTLFFELIGFIGWTFFGAFTSVIRTQAVTLLLNQMFNPVVVAARGIAMTVSTQAMVFANSFNTGLYPTIIKSYAAENYKLMHQVVYQGSKLSFFLIWIFALPLIVFMEEILRLWLLTPPEGVVLFSRLSLVEVLVMSLSLSIATAARAPGKMKEYELKLGIIQIFIFIISWLVLSFGYGAESVFIVAIGANIIMFFIRLRLVEKLVGLSALKFTKEVIYPLSIVVILSSVFAYYLKGDIESKFTLVFINTLIIMLFTALLMYFIGLSKDMRLRVNNEISRRAKFIR